MFISRAFSEGRYGARGDVRVHVGGGGEIGGDDGANGQQAITCSLGCKSRSSVQGVPSRGKEVCVNLLIRTCVLMGDIDSVPKRSRYHSDR